jgi:hypothetical protein
MFVNELINEAINEKIFSRRMRNKNKFIIYGQGARVDSQSLITSDKLFSGVIKEYFPNINFTIMSTGRFGRTKDKLWVFDAGMAGSGHPSDWENQSRGYYVELKNSVIFFPKDDFSFENLINDLKAGLNTNTIKVLNK